MVVDVGSPARSRSHVRCAAVPPRCRPAARRARIAERHTGSREAPDASSQSCMDCTVYLLAFLSTARQAPVQNYQARGVPARAEWRSLERIEVSAMSARAPRRSGPARPRRRQTLRRSRSSGGGHGHSGADHLTGCLVLGAPDRMNLGTGSRRFRSSKWLLSAQSRVASVHFPEGSPQFLHRLVDGKGSRPTCHGLAPYTSGALESESQ